jgi:hypothetical protein
LPWSAYANEKPPLIRLNVVVLTAPTESGPGLSVETTVEVLGRYSKLSQQDELITQLLKMVPAGPIGAVPRTKKQVQKRLTAGELEDFSTAYRAGSSIRELAQFFKINRTTVHAHVDTLGLPRRYPRLTRADVQEAVEMYQAGRSLITVAEHFGVAGDTVALALRRAGVEIRPRTGCER